MADAKRRAYGEDSIYFEHASGCRDPQHHRGCRGRWRGTISLGFGPDGKRVRRKVSGRTKTEIKDKLQLAHHELREGIRASPRYTVQDAIDDFLAHGLEGRSAKTVSTNREVLAPLTPYGSNPATCPVRAWRAWRDVAGLTDGPAFRAGTRHGRISLFRLGDRAVAQMVRRRSALCNAIATSIPTAQCSSKTDGTTCRKSSKPSPASAGSHGNFSTPNFNTTTPATMKTSHLT